MSDTPGLDAQVLLAGTLEKPRAWVLAHPEAGLDPQQARRYEAALQRLEGGEPLPYVLGHWEFFGLDFALGPEVLIPRPETELLVEHGLAWLQAHPGRRWAADVGAGSGCIAVTLAAHVPDLRLLAVDLSLSALRLARCNAQKHGVSSRIQFVQADLFGACAHAAGENAAPRPFDLICANLPYIPTHTLAELSVSGREPRLALHGGEDGLELIRRLLPQAPQRLAPGGRLLLEIEATQGEAAAALGRSAFPRAAVQVLPDLAGHDRLLVISNLKNP